MKAKVGRRAKVSRCPQRTRFSSSPHQAVLLVLRVADDAGRAELLDRQPRDRARLRRGQHELARARPCPRSRSSACPRRRRPARRVDVAALAVLREAERRLVPARRAARVRAARSRRSSQSSAKSRVPGRPRALRAVEALAVGRQHDRRRVGEARSARSSATHVLGRGAEAARAAHAVVARERLHGAHRALARDLLRQRRGLGCGEERRRRARPVQRGGGRRDEEKRQKLETSSERRADRHPRMLARGRPPAD